MRFSSRRFAGGALLLLAVFVLVSWLLLRSRNGGFERVLVWMPEIHLAAAEAGIDPNLLAGLVYAESRGKAGAISSIGALGLCQLLPSTAAEVAARIHVKGPPFTPQDNLRLGADYLRHMIAYCDGDVDLGLLSYRLGPSRVKQLVAAAGGSEAWFAAIREQQPSPWGYREQVMEIRDRFAATELAASSTSVTPVTQ